MWNSAEEKDFENDFNKRLEQLRKMDPATVNEIVALIEAAKNNLAPLLQKSNRTPEEEVALLKARESLQQMKQMVDDALLILSESTVRQSHAVYENIKKLAAQGNTEAIEALKELEPLYREHLKERLDENYSEN